jgi:hypothetical protein
VHTVLSDPVVKTRFFKHISPTLEWQEVTSRKIQRRKGNCNGAPQKKAVVTYFTCLQK